MVKPPELNLLGFAKVLLIDDDQNVRRSDCLLHSSTPASVEKQALTVRLYSCIGLRPSTMHINVVASQMASVKFSAGPVTVGWYVNSRKLSGNSRISTFTLDDDVLEIMSDEGATR